MKIVLVEDNRQFSERLFPVLSRLGAVWMVISEREFRESFDLMRQDPPAVFVIDTMLRWDYPRADGQEPPEDSKDLYTAGVRCAWALYRDPATRKLPVILYSVFEEADIKKKGEFPPNVAYLRKESETSGLIEAVRSAVARSITQSAAQPVDQETAAS